MSPRHPGLGPLTVEEFLAFENASTLKHEYVAGRVYAMAGTTARHNRIVGNIVRRLDAAADGSGCKTYFIDLKVRAPGDRIYYPDAVVVCTPHDDETLIFDDPCLVVEVTSRSTRRIDRGEKLDAYLAIASLRGYLIAEHDRRHVTVYVRDVRGDWEREEIVTSGRVELPCPATTLSLDDIYEGVAMPPLRLREGVDEEDDAWVGLLGPLVPR
jgi:Uma2 family endonuclease